MSRVFANGPGNQGSIPGRVILKTQKIVLDAALLTLRIIRNGSRVKWNNPGREPSGHPRQRSPTLLFTRWQEKINHLMYMFGKNEKEQETSI